MSKSKDYYIHDKDANVIYTGLGIQDLTHLLSSEYLNKPLSYCIFEYGIHENRGLGYRLNPELSVDHKFIVNLDKKQVELISD